MQILSTARLLMRTATEADLAPLYEHVFSDPEVTRHIFSGGTFTHKSALDFMRKKLNFGDGTVTGGAVLEEIETGEVIGFAGLLPCKPFGEEEIEFGFVLAQSAWGQGYASEIGQAQIDFGLRTMGRKRMFAMAHPDNEASIRAITRLGLRHDGDIETADRGPRSVFSIGRG